MALTPGTRFGPYEILAPLGAGGMGEVYRGRDSKLDREVAIKVLPAAMARDRERLARFEREAKVLASLNHPNIAQIYGLEDQDDTRALVMELVAGATLNVPQPLDTALNYAKQIADALEAAHEKGITHRDLKPANIMITPDGVVKVLDFGLASITAREPSGDPENSPTLTMGATQAGVIMGTAAYMSPEQAAGKQVDKRSDIWSFGVVLWEMLTGARLFDGETVSHTLAHVLTAQFDFGKLQAPAPVAALVKRCLERDPRKRLRDIGEARLAIESYSANPSAIVTKPSPESRRLPWVVAAVAGVAALALGILHFRAQPPELPAVRFQIPAPDKTSFGDTTNTMGMAISPDGKHIAFIAVGDSQSMMWVRSLDALTAQPLAGTEGATSPFWSPDSRTLAYFVPGKLRKVLASGGPSQTVCDLPNTGVGGSWNNHGVIVFGTNTTGLFRVSQAGGVAAQLTTQDVASGESYHSRPWFLPDGLRLLYLVRNQAQDQSAIYVIKLDGTDRKRLVAAETGGLYAPPAGNGEYGHLLFLRESTLMALPLDAKSLDPAGEALPVAEQVGSQISNSFVSLSTNGILVYRSGGGGSGSQLTWLDRQGKRLGTVGPPGDYGDVALSPDGKRVAVSSRPAQRLRDLWLLDVALGISSRFTFHAASEIAPVWSPDGGRILFASRPPRMGLYQKNASGVANEEPLLSSTLSAVTSDWSSDGHTILFTLNDPKTGADLWTGPDQASASGDRKPKPFLATGFNETGGQFLPAASGPPQWVAYASNESGRNEVYVQRFSETPSGETGKFQVSINGGMYPRWRRDGKELYFLDLGGNLMAVEIKTAPRFEHSVPKPLFRARFQPSIPAVEGPSYSPAADGSKFLAIVPVGDATSAPITVVLNWHAALRK